MSGKASDTTRIDYEMLQASRLKYRQVVVKAEKQDGAPMRWALIPDTPFYPINPGSRCEVLPMRGSSTCVRLTSRLSGVSVEDIEELHIGQELRTRHGRVRRIA